MIIEGWLDCGQGGAIILALIGWVAASRHNRLDTGDCVDPRIAGVVARVRAFPAIETNAMTTTTTDNSLTFSEIHVELDAKLDQSAHASATDGWIQSMKKNETHLHNSSARYSLGEEEKKCLSFLFLFLFLFFFLLLLFFFSFFFNKEIHEDSFKSSLKELCSEICRDSSGILAWMNKDSRNLSHFDSFFLPFFFFFFFLSFILNSLRIFQQSESFLVAKYQQFVFLFLT